MLINPAIGGTWKDWEKEHFTPEEIAESDLRVSLIGEIIETRQKLGITQQKLEELSGVKQPVIARLERDTSIPSVSILIKHLTPMKKIGIVPQNN